MKYRPNLLLNACYALNCLIVPGAVAAGVLLSSWSWSVKALLLGILVVLEYFAFPRHYLAYTLATSDEGFEYLPWVGRRKSVRWADVTGYRRRLFWLRLVRVDDRVHLLFERPLLIQDRRLFLEELERRCPTARRLSLTEYLGLVWRGMKEAAANSRSLSDRQREGATDDEEPAQPSEGPDPNNGRGGGPSKDLDSGRG